jgi:hypothetical protein
MYMLRLLLAGALVALPAAAASQVISGRVVEDETGTGIVGVVITAMSREGRPLGEATSDTTGAYLLRLASAGDVQLRLTHPSYLSPGPVSVSVAGATTVAVELRMSRTAIPLRPVIVGGQRDLRLSGFDERRRSGGAGQFLTRADIERRPAARTTDLLRELHGVEIVTVGTGIARPRVNIIAFRGGRGRCTATVYIDGIVVGQFPDSGLDDFLRPDMIEGAEVYTSANTAPASLSSRDACGVVAFWTRPVEDTQAWSWTRIALGAASLGGLLLIILLTR